MTIFARDVDTGMAKWVYQMTPFDEWDFDGINEMILADIDVKGKATKALVHFDRNGFGYTMDRVTGALLVAEKYDPTVNWATHVDMKTGRPQVVAKYSTAKNGPDVNTKGVCPAALGSKDQQPASFDPEHQAVLRADQPRLHGLRAVQGRVHRRPAVCRRHAVDVPGARAATVAWATTSPGTPAPARSCRAKPEKFSVWSGSLNTAGGLSCYGTLEGYLKCVDAKDINKELLQVQDALRDHRQRVHLRAQGQAVHRRVLGHRRLGRHRHGRRPREGHRRPGRGGWLPELNQYTELGGSLTVFALPN